MSENVIHAVSGATAGMAAMAVTYPLITLSTRAQVDAKGEHRSIRAALKRILEKEGIPGLYSGLRSALFGIGITNGIYYWWYEWSKGVIEKAAIKSSGQRRPLTTPESMLAGLIAGSATVIFTNPIWVVNTRETARKDTTDESKERDLKNLPPTDAAKEAASGAGGFLKILKDIVKNEGIKALWSGVIPALVLVINPIIQYTVFEQLKAALERRRRARLTPNDAFLLGALGKLMATGITYPYITIKARMQLKQSADVNQQYTGTIVGLKKIINDEGLLGLYKGVAPKLTQSVLNAAFLFMFKEFFFNLSKAALHGHINHGSKA